MNEKPLLAIYEQTAPDEWAALWAYKRGKQIATKRGFISWDGEILRYRLSPRAHKKTRERAIRIKAPAYLARGLVLTDLAIAIGDDGLLTKSWLQNYRPTYLRLPWINEFLARPRPAYELREAAEPYVMEGLPVSVESARWKGAMRFTKSPSDLLRLEIPKPRLRKILSGILQFAVAFYPLHGDI